MKESKQERVEAKKSTEQLKAERQSDATDDETLKDVEASQRSLGSGETNRSPGPSPDGALDESEEIDDAGPM